MKLLSFNRPLKNSFQGIRVNTNVNLIQVLLLIDLNSFFIHFKVKFSIRLSKFYLVT